MKEYALLMFNSIENRWTIEIGKGGIIPLDTEKRFLEALNHASTLGWDCVSTYEHGELEKRLFILSKNV